MISFNKSKQLRLNYKFDILFNLQTTLYKFYLKNTITNAGLLKTFKTYNITVANRLFSPICMVISYFLWPQFLSKYTLK